uniref:M20_dimer domain-containing protein n=1 Tax=Steinernema glaseri TaxID=37863 RepID=A0A1I7XWY4_9BILA
RGADMDALPVQERNDLPFKSVAKGTWQGKEVSVSHACGHDTHVAMLLGAAKVFSDMRDELPGTIVLLFQPAEEQGPGKPLSGANAMMAEGVLDQPKVDVVMGQHIGPSYPAGSIGYRQGSLMASGDVFSISLAGKGGHGSSPWNAASPVVAAAETVVALNNIIAQRTNPQDGTTVVTVGSLQSGNRPNVLPESADISGTVRSLSKQNQATAHELIQRYAQNIAANHDLKATVRIDTGYEVLVSDPKATQTVIPALDMATDGIGAKEVAPGMGSEDFVDMTTTHNGVNKLKQDSGVTCHSGTELLNLIMAYSISTAVRAAAELELADLLKDGPKTIASLAQASGTEASHLQRILRVLCAHRVFKEQPANTYQLDELGWNLCSDSSSRLKEAALMLTDPAFLHCAADLSKAAAGIPIFRERFGHAFFEHWEDNDIHDIFHQGVS